MVQGRRFATVRELLPDSVCPRASEQTLLGSDLYWDIILNSVIP